MSQFDEHTQAAYIQGLGRFLGKQHSAVLHINSRKPTGCTGRLSKWPQEVVEALEQAVNAKAKRCEAYDSTLSERIALARHYRKLNCAQVARCLGVSREAVRRWCAGLAVPSDWSRLALVLDVPDAWLKLGGEEYLPADSHLGVRVGSESMAAREDLFGLTLAFLADAEDTMGIEELMACLEKAVFLRKDMADFARRAGGRWHIYQGALAFVPWVSITPHGLALDCLIKSTEGEATR